MKNVTIVENIILRVELDRHKCYCDKEVSKRISRFTLNKKNQNNPDICFQVDVKQELMEEDPLGMQWKRRV